MGALIAFLVSMFSRLLAGSALRIIAAKVILTTLFITILPIILNNFVYKMMEIVINIVNEKVNGATATLQPVVLSAAGLGAWFASCLRAPECLAIMIAFVCLRFTLTLLPRPGMLF